MQRVTGLAVLGFSVILLGLFLFMPAPSSGYHARPIIMWAFEDFESQGQVNQPGTLVTLSFVAREEGGEIGHSIQYRVTATQAHTGATAVEEIRSGIPVNASRPSLTTRIRPAAGSPRFEPGPVEVTAVGTHLSKDGQVVRTWTWTSTVELAQR